MATSTASTDVPPAFKTFIASVAALLTVSDLHLIMGGQGVLRAHRQVDLLVLDAVEAGTSVDEDRLWHLEKGLVRTLFGNLAGRHTGGIGVGVCFDLVKKVLINKCHSKRKQSSGGKQMERHAGEEEIACEQTVCEK